MASPYFKRIRAVICESWASVSLGGEGRVGGVEDCGEGIREATRDQSQWGVLKSETSRVRGKLSGAVWSQYEQEPPPGAPDYLILPTRPRLDMLD